MSKIVSWLLFLSVAEVKKRGETKIDGFRKKLIISESEISECPEHKVKSKIGNIFLNEKYLKNILLRFKKLILIFMSITKKKNKLRKKGVNTYCLELMFTLLNIF